MVSHCHRPIKRSQWQSEKRSSSRFPHSLIVPTKYFKWSAAKLWWQIRFEFFVLFFTLLAIKSLKGTTVTYFVFVSLCMLQKETAMALKWIAFWREKTYIEFIVRSKVRRNIMLSHKLVAVFIILSLEPSLTPFLGSFLLFSISRKKMFSNERLLLFVGYERWLLCRWAQS